MNALKFTCTFLLLSLCLQVFSQDLIYRRNGTKDSVIVQDTSQEEIVYKLFNSPSGNTYKLSKSEIILIEFEDGKIMLIASQKDYKQNLPGRNLVSINALSLLFTNAHLNYELVFKNPKYSLRFIVNTNVGIYTANYVAYDRLFAGGVDFNYYPKKQKRFSYYLGPGIRAGRLRDPDYATGFWGGAESEHYNYAGIYMNMGVNVSVTKHLFFGIQAGLGVARYMPVENPSGKENAYSSIDGLCSLNLGCRF